MSDVTTSIHGKIVAAMSEIPVIERNKVNKYTGNAYADIGAISAAINPAFFKQGLFITQTTHDAIQDGDKVFRLETVCYDADGDQFSFGKTPWFMYTWNPQETGTAMTYARRYGYVTALNLAAEDDDGETAKLLSTEWASDERVEELKKMVADSAEGEDGKATALKRWNTYMVTSGMLIDGRMPLDKYETALKQTKNTIENKKN